MTGLFVLLRTRYVCYMVGSNFKDAGIGARLRQAREDRNWSQREAAARSGYSDASVSRWETGQKPPSPEALASYATTLGVPPAEREQLIALLKRGDASIGLLSKGAEQQQLTATLVELEQSATDMFAWSMALVHGLLQTGEYARAMMRAVDLPEQEITQRVVQRMGRRDAVTRPRNPVRLTVFMGEAALRHLIGGNDVMLEQLRYLREMADRPNVDVRIVPDTSNYHPGLDVGSFTLIDFSQRSSVVQVDAPNAVTFFDSDTDIAFYRWAVDRVMGAAMDPVASSESIAQAISAAEQDELETT